MEQLSHVVTWCKVQLKTIIFKQLTKGDAMKVTNSDLESLVDRINEATGNKKEAWDKTGERSKANVGTYYIDGAYGGVMLAQMVNVGGGIDTISRDGYGTKKELYTFMTAYLLGFNIGKGIA